jgi:hypothetical protein
VIGRVLRDAWSHSVSSIAAALRGSGRLRRADGRYAVTVVSPPGHIHSAAFAEIAETLHYALRSLGHDSVITTDGDLADRRHIVLGSNLLPGYPMRIAGSAILYNLEQVESASPWLSPELLRLFRSHVLWDYSRRNAAALKAFDVQVAHVLPVGYVKELTRIRLAPAPDIDVLFFGSVNPRRRDVIDAMRATGLNVQAVFGAYGAERDALIARSKLVLNLHYYEAKVLEIVRISYLLANRCAVLSERGADPAEDEQLAGGVAFAEYHDLVRRACELIEAPEERARLALRGFEIMSARSAPEYLRAALTQPV